MLIGLDWILYDGGTANQMCNWEVCVCELGNDKDFIIME